jgi:DNA-binding transcriptional LysR family regulator
MIIGKKLEIFLAVAQAGSFSAATKILSISQSVVSHHIEDLEKEMGVPLFERRGRTIKLTEEGEFLYEKGQKLFNEAERVEELISEKSKKIASRIHLAGDALTCAYTLPWNLAAFRTDHPSVIFTYEHLPTEKLIEKLLSEELDVALVGYPVRNQKLSSQQCFIDEIILVGHPEQMPDKIELSELPNIPLGWINNDKGLSMKIAHDLGAAGMPMKNLNIFMEVQDLPILKSFMRTGVACAFLPKISVEDELKFGLLKEIPIAGIDLRRTTFLMHRRTKNTKEIVAEFIKFIDARLYEENRDSVEKLQKHDGNSQ